MFTSWPNNVAKGNLASCSYSCKEKRAAREKFVVFYLLIGLVSFDVLVAVHVAVAAAAAVARSSLLPGFIDVGKRLGIRTRFLVKTSAIFSLDIIVKHSVH